MSKVQRHRPYARTAQQERTQDQELPRASHVRRAHTLPQRALPPVGRVLLGPLQLKLAQRARPHVCSAARADTRFKARQAAHCASAEHTSARLGHPPAHRVLWAATRLFKEQPRQAIAHSARLARILPSQVRHLAANVWRVHIVPFQVLQRALHARRIRTLRRRALRHARRALPASRPALVRLHARRLPPAVVARHTTRLRPRQLDYTQALVEVLRALS